MKDNFPSHLIKMAFFKKHRFIFIGLLSAGAVFLFWKYVIEIPHYAEEYSVAPLSCSYQKNNRAQINFDFIPSGKSLNKIPRYSMRELWDHGKTEIIFYNTNGTDRQFSYDEVFGNPLIENLDYYQRGKNFIVTIYRKGAFLPAEILQNETTAEIILREGNADFPLISGQKPADNSAAWPAFRIVSFEATLKDSLKKAIIFFQEKPIEFSSTEIAQNTYLFQFKETIIKDNQYSVKAIIADAQGRTTIGVWAFEGQVLAKTVLGDDRFKYLGWWGEVNANDVIVRERPGTLFKKLGNLSSINRVKVLKETYGEIVNDNSVWYEIDGGKYPHAYIFSEYVTPIPQPEPPNEFTIPKSVGDGERWIDVDLTKKIITLFEYDKPIFASYVSPGREKNPTVEGTFRIWYKLRKTEMKGGPPLHDYKYDLTDVPRVLYYEESYAIHGTYWHDRFGSPQSAGCTNLTQGDADFIFEKVKPELKPDAESVVSKKDNPGTIVYNHY